MNSASSTRRLLLLAVVLAISPFAVPQTPAGIAGNWQGTIHGPRQDVRLVVKVEKADNGVLSATTYLIDQNGAPVATSVSLQGTTVKFSLPSVNASYTGQWNGNSIIGNWMQGTSISLDFIRATKDNAWDVPAPPPPRKRMLASTDPIFEEATIKPSNPDSRGGGFNSSGKNFTVRNKTLSAVMQWAYGVQAKQIIGGPDWLDTANFDIAAVFPDGAGDTDIAQDQAALRKLMTNRFKLTFHHEKRELSVYSLAVAKGGSKLAKTQSTEPDFSIRQARVPGGLTLPVRSITMSEFAGYIQRSMVDRPVVDQTGITGKYDFILKWAPETASTGYQSPSLTTAETLPDLFEALQEQLGLKLEAVKAPVDVLVVDQAEKPSEN